MKVIAYFVYGQKREYQLELFYSIASALKCAAGSQEIQISVISDRDDFDPALPIDLITISPAEFAEWTRNGAYNHRAKPCALLKLLDHYQAPVVLVDTDTCFVDHPVKLFERISPQSSVMYRVEHENPIENTVEWSPIVEQLGDKTKIDEVYLSRFTPLINSGVIGVDYSHRPLIEKALVLIDKLYAISPVFNIEQFAIGAVLSQFTNLSETQDILQHYCGYSREFIHFQIAKLFPNFSALTLNQALRSDLTIELELPPKPFLDKMLTRLLAFTKRWDDNYRFAYLAYRCAVFHGENNSSYANAWAKIALQSVKFAVEKHRNDQAKIAPLSEVERDFKWFSRDNILALSWLNPETKNSWLQSWEQWSMRQQRCTFQADARLVFKDSKA